MKYSVMIFTSFEKYKMWIEADNKIKIINVIPYQQDKIIVTYQEDKSLNE